MLNYKAFFGNKLPIDIMDASSAYDAQCRAARVWNLKPSQQYKISVVIAERDGVAVAHLTSEL